MKIEHVAIWVSELESMKDFYCSNFAGVANTKYVNQSKGFSSYFIKFASGTRIELMHNDTVSTNCHKPSLGFAHLAFSVGDKVAVDNLTEKLRAQGIIVASEPRTTGDGYYESLILDPENNQIEITE